MMIPKYRAWDKIKKKMGNVESLGLKEFPSVIQFPDGDADSFFLDGEKCVELLQWTGLKDVNGVDIYEGDIVVGEPPYYVKGVKGVVEYCGLAFVFKGKMEDGKCWFDTITRSGIKKVDHIKVIGNRFMNPELLEG